MFLEAMQDVLPNLTVVIDNGDGNIWKYYSISDLLNGTGGTDTSGDTTGTDTE
jgi:hypothetical protein